MLVNVRDTVGIGITPLIELEYLGYNDNNEVIEVIDLSGIFQSLTIKESEREILSGSISFWDRTGALNRALQYGSRFHLKWGLSFDDYPSRPGGFLGLEDNEIEGFEDSFTRGPMTVMTANSSQTLSENKSVIKVDFLAGERVGFYQKKSRQWPDTRKGKIKIKDLLKRIIETEMKCRAFIDFDDQDIEITYKNPLRQHNETNLGLLYRLAAKYNVKLVYQHDPINPFKIASVFFVAWAKQSKYRYAELRGLRGLYHYYDYATQSGNMLDSWSCSPNFNAPGGSTATSFQDAQGRTSLRFIKSKTESVEVWELDYTALDRDREKGLKHTRELAKFAEDADFDSFDYRKKPWSNYFKKSTRTTAPEGQGYTARGPIVPNPIQQPGDLVHMGRPGSGEGLIAPQFRTSADKSWTFWRVVSQEQKIDSGGYKHTVELAR